MTSQYSSDVIIHSTPDAILGSRYNRFMMISNNMKMITNYLKILKDERFEFKESFYYSFLQTNKNHKIFLNIVHISKQSIYF